jgi:hypothetical protein
MAIIPAIARLRPEHYYKFDPVSRKQTTTKNKE